MAKQNTSQLLFGALIRVSTEKQEKTGESLRTQKSDIIETVKQLKGKIVGWYGGQESATPGHEKKEIDRLLHDAQKGRFNALIVNNADRWSRDNKKSNDGLKVFENMGVRFFVGLTEYSLHNPEHKLFLGMSSVIGGFLAANQNRKSIINRIARAKRGIPTVGNLPVARTFNKKTQKWGIDNEKHEKIKEIANRYLEGEGIEALANEFKMNRSALHKNLMHRCGGTWEVGFNSDEFNIHETIKIKVPRLLPDKTIKAIREKTQANKTYTHGKLKNKYLLSRMIFCGHCGYAMCSQTNIKPTFINRYYRHGQNYRQGKPCPEKKNWLRCEQLDDIVIRYLFEMFGNPKAVQEAIERAIPNLDKIKEYQNRIERLNNNLEEIDKGRDKVVKLNISGRLTDDEAGEHLDELNQKKEQTKDEINRLSDCIQNIPNPKNLKAVSKKIYRNFKSGAINAKRRAITKTINSNFEEMTFDEKRGLVESVFSGKTPDGKRMGVYIYWDEDGNWSFDIKGQFIDLEGLKPNSYAPDDFSEAGVFQKDLTKSASPLLDIRSSLLFKFHHHFRIIGQQGLKINHNMVCS